MNYPTAQRPVLGLKSGSLAAAAARLTVCMHVNVFLPEKS